MTQQRRSSSSRKLTAGVIGLGSMGTSHARVYSEIDGVELAAVADVSPERLLGHGDAHGYEDYRQMLAEESLDIVSVCVPTLLHQEVAMAAIERGVALLVEKPLAATIEEGRALALAARDANVALMVGHVERFNPAVLEMKRRLAADEIGRVFQVQARRTGPFPRRVRDVGVVHDLAPHDIDIMRFLLESEVERVYAETESGVRTEREDTLAGVLRFANGVIGLLDVNWLTPVKVRQLSVLGERGLLVADYLAQEVRLYRNDEAGAPMKQASEQLPVEKREPLRVELESFVEAVRRGMQPAVSAEEGLAALAVAEALAESGKKHLPVGLVFEEEEGLAE